MTGASEQEARDRVDSSKLPSRQNRLGLGQDCIQQPL